MVEIKHTGRVRMPKFQLTPPVFQNLAYVYFVQVGKFVKIGCARNVKKRLEALQNGCPFRYRLLAMVQATTKCERCVHDMFNHCRYRGEWFHFTDELREYIEAVNELGWLGKEVEDAKWH